MEPDDEGVLNDVLAKLDGVRNQHGYWMARCPAHEDSTASLQVTRGTEQPVVMVCMAGCDTQDVLAAVGLTLRDISTQDQPETADKNLWTPYGQAAEAYSYADEDGVLLYQVMRVPPGPGGKKQFPVRVPDPGAKSGWRWRMGDTRRVLYRLPRLRSAIESGEIIWVAEGEKDVHSLECAGVVATCNPGGAGKWRKEYSEVLRDAIVMIVADADKPGREHARTIAASLDGIAACSEICEAATGKDISDHLAGGHTLAEVEITKEAAADREPELAIDLLVFVAQPDPPDNWVIEDLLEHGDRLIWTGEEGLGKALCLDTPVPTPKGWTTMGRLSTGDEVFGADGYPVRINFATPAMYGHPCYRVTFSDGASIVADADHLWLTETLAAREAHQRHLRKTGPLKKRGTDQKHKRLNFPAVISTTQIRDTLTVYENRANHSVQTCEPLRYPAQELPVAPYTFGAWLGDGSSNGPQMACADADAEIIGHIGADGYATRRLDRGPAMPMWSFSARDLHHCTICGNGPLHARQLCHRCYTRETARCAIDKWPLTGKRSLYGVMRMMGVLGSKHIPEVYLRASFSQRLALLQGLMDTDGTVSADGSQSGRGSGAAICEFSVVSERLARDVHELLLSFGIKVRFRSGPAVLNGRAIGTRYRLSFQTDLPVFRLQRKAARLTSLRTRRAKLRYIKSVEPVESVPVRCIAVDSEDHLYLAGRECIPTHNTTVTRQVAVAAAAGIHPFKLHKIPPQRVLFIDCENRVSRSRRKFRELVDACGKKHFPVQAGMFRIVHRPGGINVLRADDAEFIYERVTAYRPDLLVVGPLYKMHAIDANEELAARALVHILDQALEICQSALIVEAHSPHGTPRSLRPRGSSLFMGWPDFGYGIYVPEPPKGEARNKRRVRVDAWRGPREDYGWPKELMWGNGRNEFPWVDPTAESRTLHQPHRPPEPPHLGGLDLSHPDP